MSCIWVKRRTSVLLQDTSLLFLLFCLIGCDAYRPKPYITPEVRFNKMQVEMGTPVEMEYFFKTADDYPGLKKDLTVFVHFLDPHKIIRFVDDHQPPVLTNQWNAGQEYRYTRTVFVPENIPRGEYTVELGMYTPSGKGERFALNAKRISERSYDVGKFHVIPNVTLARTDYVQGWFDMEREPNNNWWHWRWTSGEATARLPNPKTDSFLYLNAEADRFRFETPQEIAVYLGNQKFENFVLETEEPVWKKYAISANQLGNAEFVEVKLQVDKTFIPGGSDPRELGIRVYCLYLGPQKTLK